MIQAKDVLNIAKQLNFIKPTNEQIQYVLDIFNEEARRDSTGDWQVWIENLLYEQDLPQADSLYYKDKNYGMRTLCVEIPSIGDLSIKIAPQSLSDAMGNPDEYGEEENCIDESIYFYVEDEVFLNDAKDICENHLDEPIKFYSEIFG